MCNFVCLGGFRHAFPEMTGWKIASVARGEIREDVTSIALEGWRHIQVGSHIELFADFSLDDCRQKEEEEGTQVVRTKRKKRVRKGFNK